MPEERILGLPYRTGHAEAEGAQQGSQLGQPFVDVTADQELGRRQPLELEGLGRRGRLSGLRVGLGRVGATSGIGERVAQSPPEEAGLDVRPLVQLERGPIQSRRVVEGQRRGGLVGPARVIVAGGRGVAGTAVVTGEDLGIDRTRGRQHQGQALMVPAQDVRRKMSGNGLSNPIVVGLDLVMLCLPDAPDQPRGAERGQSHATAGPQLGRLKRQRLADRPPRNRHHRQQTPRLLGLPLNPRPEHLVQIDLPDIFPPLRRLAGLDVLDEFVDEQRIARRLAPTMCAAPATTRRHDPAEQASARAPPTE